MIKPLASIDMKPVTGKVIVKFSTKEIERSKFFGRVFLPQTITNAGEYATETATVVSVCDGVDWLKPNDRVIISYLIAYDAVNSRPKNAERIDALDNEMNELQYELNKKRMNRQDTKIVSARIEYIKEQMIYEDTNNTYSEKNQYYIDTDEQGNQIRWCTVEDIYGVIKGSKIAPSLNWVFIHEPIVVEDKNKGKIVLLTKKQDREKKAFEAKVKYINDLDKKEVKFKKGDTIFVAPQFDFKFKVGEKREWAVPLNKILGLRIFDEATA